MNKARITIPSITILLSVALVTLSGCSLTGSNAAATTPTTAVVAKGDITTYITASGNLSYPDTQDVRLQVGGTVSEVLVQAGDMVKQGDVLVKLDDSTIQDKITSDQLVINSAGISLEQKNNAYQKLIYPFSSYTTFGINIPTAIADMNDAQQKVDDARDRLLKADTADETTNTTSELLKASQSLDDAINKLTFGQGPNVFASTEITTSAGGKTTTITTSRLSNADYWTLRSAQLDIESSQANLDNANNNLANDQSDLDKTVVKAPFDGLITNVAATDGAVMNQNNVAVTMTNPNKLEADVLVNEIDIFNVKINGTATVSVDATQGLVVPATVTYIEPTATIQSGVVNYNVKVELNQPPATNSNQTASTRTPSRPGGAAATGAANSFASLRQGLSVTVNILKDTKSGVLLVPNRALIRQGTNTTVQVQNATGTIETRTVQTGVSDTRNTEITQGLSEGDKIIVQVAATRAATPATGGGLFGGGGRPPFAAGSVGGR